jgi:hypothetical protein
VAPPPTIAKPKPSPKQLVKAIPFKPSIPVVIPPRPIILRKVATPNYLRITTQERRPERIVTLPPKAIMTPKSKPVLVCR